MREDAVYSFEVMKQFRFVIPGMKEEVIGEVRLQLLPQADSSKFTWWISHHYKPTANALGVYYPSSISGSSEEEVTAHLMAYAASFTAEFGVKKNTIDGI